MAGFTQGAQGQGPVAFGEAPAAFVGQQVVMAIARRGQAQQGLQQAVNMGRLEQILARVTSVTRCKASSVVTARW